MWINSDFIEHIHQLLPFSERLSQILPNSCPECSLCADQLLDPPLHGLFRCIRNSQASQYLLHLTRPYDSSISEERILLLDIRTSEQIYELPSMLVLATGLSYIWSNRLIKKSTTLFMICSDTDQEYSMKQGTWSTTPWSIFLSNC